MYCCVELIVFSDCEIQFVALLMASMLRSECAIALHFEWLLSHWLQNYCLKLIKFDFKDILCSTNTGIATGGPDPLFWLGSVVGLTQNCWEFFGVGENCKKVINKQALLCQDPLDEPFLCIYFLCWGLVSVPPWLFLGL